MASGLDPLVDDDVAYVTPWGVELSHIAAPVLLVHGAEDANPGTTPLQAIDWKDQRQMNEPRREQRLRQQIDIGLADPEGQRRLPHLVKAPGQGPARSR